MLTYNRVAKAAGKHLSRALLRLRGAGGARKSHQCTACQSEVVGFFRYGNIRHWGCPVCESSPRERLMNYALGRELLEYPSGASILHIAPNERSLVERFSANGSDYSPADLDPSRYPVPGVRKVDLMQMDEEERFDLIYASHVMEHVPDDRLVLRNIRRALKPAGQAWLIVPLAAGPTVDGDMEMPPKIREKMFGQWDHVRQYGDDFADRIREAGLSLSILAAKEMPAADQHRFGLDDKIFVATRAG